MSVYDFDDDDGSKPSKMGRIHSVKVDSKLEPPDERSSGLDLPPKLKLKVSGGKVVV